MEELNSELEELRELSAKRLDELEKKTNEHKEALKEVERLKMDVSVCCNSTSLMGINNEQGTGLMLQGGSKLSGLYSILMMNVTNGDQGEQVYE